MRCGIGWIRGLGSAPGCSFPILKNLSGFWTVEAESGQLCGDGSYFRVHEAVGPQTGADGSLVEWMPRAFAVDEPDGNGSGELRLCFSQCGGKGFGSIDIREDEVRVARGDSCG